MAKAGNGGNPAPNALRRPHLPKGPGYGGHGGSVILKATTQIESFLDIPQTLGEVLTESQSGRDWYRSLSVSCGSIPMFSFPFPSTSIERPT